MRGKFAACLLHLQAEKQFLTIDEIARCCVVAKEWNEQMKSRVCRLLLLSFSHILKETVTIDHSWTYMRTWCKSFFPVSKISCQNQFWIRDPRNPNEFFLANRPVVPLVRSFLRNMMASFLHVRNSVLVFCCLHQMLEPDESMYPNHQTITKIVRNKKLFTKRQQKQLIDKVVDKLCADQLDRSGSSVL